MVEEKVITLGFNKETLKPSPILSTQQSRGMALKIAPQKGKRPKQEFGGGFSSYTIE
jgi:hypothetical protein